MSVGNIPASGGAPRRKSLWDRHKIFETNSILLILGVLVVISIGGLVEIAPLFYLRSTIEKVEGMRPYSPLELAGRAIYVREGCYNCHSQMVRPLRDEIERYGHYSLAAESMYDKPFQWGSKRTGPDLARVGGKYSDEWQLAHLVNPRSVVPGSIMPGYPFLARTELDVADLADHMRANRASGVPYTDEQIDAALKDLQAQADPEHPGAADVAKRYPKAVERNFDGDPKLLTEADALIAYLQMLGTLVDFKLYDNKANIR
jgi:cytochrome c oxidase cbb3-type subunit 2